MEKNNKQKDIEMNKAAHQLINWQRQDKHNRVCVVLAWDTKSSECIVAESGRGESLVTLFAKAIDSDENIKSQIKVALLASSLKNLSEDK